MWTLNKMQDKYKLSAFKMYQESTLEKTPCSTRNTLVTHCGVVFHQLRNTALEHDLYTDFTFKAPELFNSQVLGKATVIDIASP